MGDYTRIGLVRSATGFTIELTPSASVNFAIRRGEAALRKYLGITPASDATSMSTTNDWVELAATSFSAHYLALRLANQNIANSVYQRQTTQDRGAPFGGHTIAASDWWQDAITVCDMHGRNVTIQRITSS